MIDEESSASGHDYASDRSAIGDSYRGVSLRHFIRGTGGHRPDALGGFWTPCEWKCFINADEEPNTLIPEISRTETCISTHNNQEHGMPCFECHPGGDCLFVCESLTSLCHSNGHIETMPAREINRFTALTRIRS